MLLREYIRRRGIPVAEFGRRVGVDKRQTMHRYVNGTAFPPAEVMRAIVRETAGEVTANDFYGISDAEIARAGNKPTEMRG